MNAAGCICSLSVAALTGIIAKASYRTYTETHCISCLVGAIIFTGVAVMLVLVAISCLVDGGGDSGSGEIPASDY